ncbi:speckle-type POZ protein-like [Aphidius gifuensis]|uniref:speckle-type POZ protein-like n=1 Tax=Aphidius gifuensis TaxID=684658 RepID=UPI001CDC5143|nr:speckle-type POZ protein-like [Aphidius gifuensis]
MSGVAGSTRDSIKFLMANQNYVTGEETCKFTYKWKVENFISQYTRGTIKSPTFSSNYSDVDDEWVLKINPNKATGSDGDYESDSQSSSSESDDSKSDNNNKYISVELQLQSFNVNAILMTKCRISFNHGNEKTKEYDFDQCPDEIIWNHYISKAKLFKSFNKYIRNDELRVYCTITITKKLTNNDDDDSSTFNTTPQLSEDWKKLLLNKKSSDVTIRVGNKSFRAIKGILGVRSPVFSAMFDNKQFKEDKRNEVVIDDIEEDVERLKNICEDIICEKINLDDVAGILVCSDRFNLEKLNKECLEFMKRNLRDVMANKTFQVYKKKYPEIFVGVLEELLLS